MLLIFMAKLDGMEFIIYFLHPSYNWACCWDLKEPVEPYLKLGYKDLEKAMKKNTKVHKNYKTKSK